METFNVDVMTAVVHIQATYKMSDNNVMGYASKCRKEKEKLEGGSDDETKDITTRNEERRSHDLTYVRKQDDDG